MLNLVIAVAGIAAGVFLALVFLKAGSFKLKGTKEQFAAAQWAWAENVPLGAIRLLGTLQVLGAVGSVLAPLVALVPGFEWAKVFAVAAPAGLALTMLAAAIMHGVRGELKYTAKSNFSLFGLGVAAAVLNGLVVLPLQF